VNFLIVLVTASITVLTAVAKDELVKLEPTDAGLLVGLALSALLALGLVTLQRMLRRNIVTDEYKNAMDQIRKYFKTWDTLIKEYEPFRKDNKENDPEVREPGRGGLADMVAVINSVVVAGLALLLTQSYSCHLTLRILLALMASIIAVLAQYLYMKYYYEKEAGKHKGE
jgi:hypothetical protein